MRARSKRYKADAAKIDPRKKYAVSEAVAVLKSFAPAKFDQTVNIAIKLNIDSKQSDQSIRGSVALPNGIGQTRKVIVFADGDEARIAKEAGAIEVGGEDLVKKVADGWMDFDVAIALPRMMKVVSKLGKALGPQGKMPTPKTGTVTDEVALAVKEFAAGKVEFRNDAAGNIHAPVGRLSFAEEKLRANVEAFIEHIRGLRPPSVKGPFMTNAAISATMSPGLTLQVGGPEATP